MLHLLLRCLACLLVALTTFSAAAKAPAKAKPAPAPAPVVLDADDDEAPPAPAPPPAAAPAAAADADDSDEEGSEGTQSAGIECVPAISEIEVRRPLPFSCSVTKEGVDQVELRYKAPGRKKWTKVRFRRSGQDYTGEIPCTALTRHGTLRLSLVGLDADDKPLARIGGVQIAVVEASNQPPPALPGREPPMRCYDPQDCPNELKGSPACPGTKAVPGARTWGAACEKTSQCQTGLACVSGTCDKPPKCESASECPSGECVSGSCVFPDPDEVASRLGPPKFNWIGLHFGWDFALGRSGVGVCGTGTDDSKDYDCFNGQSQYDPTFVNANTAYQGTASSGVLPSTMRIMASYERWFGRLGAGARVGWAFGGAPKDFSPIHLEARIFYSMRTDPLNKRFRPYIGLAGGMGEVDAHSKTSIIDCSGATDKPACIKETNLDTLSGLHATAPKLDVYRHGSAAFFGPTLGFVYALANDSGIQFNVNMMLPEVAFEPTLGYVMGL
jgi:hypothetical protein